MGRIASVALAAGTIALAGCGCGGGGDAPSTAPAQRPEQLTRIVLDTPARPGSDRRAALIRVL
ncbi:MAG TPA: hypothetical protein VIL49_01800, partial [Capillimicrobium sp.]